MAANRMSTSDPNSYSEPEKCLMKSLSLDWTVDFPSHRIHGLATLKLERKIEHLEYLVLDVRDLTIERVSVESSDENLPFDVTNPAGVDFGQKLTIKLESHHMNRNFSLVIKYSTAENSSALQWLSPQQTAGKRHPYLFSQCQAIHARSLYPCQDTPRVKFPYEAQVRAPKEITVLMSAERQRVDVDSADPSQAVTKFSLKVPIPSYLLAIVAGDLESRQIGPRSKVWAEKEIVDAAAFEFSETESMLTTAESLMGPYVWGHYDLLVLPPSFPYGGMENPCLTFVTPTLLAGDRSLADVIAHEISHSWTGNLVTNNTFEHFWLNEGHTRFVESKIVTALNKGSDAHFGYLVHKSWTKLSETVEKLKEKNEEPYTVLVPDLVGVDPDDAFSAVPYEKGFALLYHLETLLGGQEVFEKFLRAYIERFKYQSINSDDWKNFLYEYFSSSEDQARLNTVDWQAWLHGPGLPPFQPNYDLSLVQPSHTLGARWQDAPEDSLDQFKSGDMQDWSSLLLREFLSHLNNGPVLSLAKVQTMQDKYSLHSVRNSEARFIWLQLCIKVRWLETLPRVFEFVNEQGRMKFVRPLYQSLYAWEEVRPQVLQNYKEHKDEMHGTTATLLAKDLHLKDL